MRLLLVDDHPLMRVGVAHLVREEWPDAIIDEAATIAAALERIAAARPDLVVLDLSLPDASGLEGASRVLRVLALSGGYSREEACALLARNPAMIASFSRALLEGLTEDQTDDQFNAVLEASIEQIYRASVAKQPLA